MGDAAMFIQERRMNNPFFHVIGIEGFRNLLERISRGTNVAIFVHNNTELVYREDTLQALEEIVVNNILYYIRTAVSDGQTLELENWKNVISQEGYLAQFMPQIGKSSYAIDIK